MEVTMANAGEWVRQIVFKCQDTPMSTEEIFKSLEKNVGVNENTLNRVQAIADYIDQQMIERNDGPVMRQLWAAVSDYLEKVLEARAAA
jgi:hypothetical protein